MKKLLLAISLLSPLALVACATNSTSKQSLKKSPCACVYKPIPSAEHPNALNVVSNSV